MKLLLFLCFIYALFAYELDQDVDDVEKIDKKEYLIKFYPNKSKTIEENLAALKELALEKAKEYSDKHPKAYHEKAYNFDIHESVMKCIFGSSNQFTNENGDIEVQYREMKIKAEMIAFIAKYRLNKTLAEYITGERREEILNNSFNEELKYQNDLVKKYHTKALCAVENKQRVVTQGEKALGNDYERTIRNYAKCANESYCTAVLFGEGTDEEKQAKCLKYRFEIFINAETDLKTEHKKHKLLPKNYSPQKLKTKLAEYRVKRGKKSRDAYFKKEIKQAKDNYVKAKGVWDKIYSKLGQYEKQFKDEISKPRTDQLSAANGRIDNEWLPAVNKLSPKQDQFKTALAEVNNEIDKQIKEYAIFEVYQRGKIKLYGKLFNYLNSYYEYVILRLYQVKVLAERKIK